MEETEEDEKFQERRKSKIFDPTDFAHLARVWPRTGTLLLPPDRPTSTPLGYVNGEFSEYQTDASSCNRSFAFSLRGKNQ